MFGPAARVQKNSRGLKQNRQMRALIVWGGWDGHEPEAVADLFREQLVDEGFEVEVTGRIEDFQRAAEIKDLRLIVPVVTMAHISPEACRAVCNAVESGVGIAGCHGGMCDSFRESTEWQFLTGGQWVAHPGDDGVEYLIEIERSVPHPITDGISDFTVRSEQYYLHVDPGIQVLATCRFPNPKAPGVHSGNPCRMPQVWTKTFGRGRVFYCALGHRRTVLEGAEPREIMRRGFRWAAGLNISQAQH